MGSVKEVAAQSEDLGRWSVAESETSVKLIQEMFNSDGDSRASGLICKRCV